VFNLAGLSKKNFYVSGIVIKKKNFFESDRIIDIFSLEKGIIPCVVKGARKPSSKLSGVSELFTYGTFYLSKGKNLDILTSAKPETHFAGEGRDLDRISGLFLMFEVLGKLLPHEVPNPKIFDETLSAAGKISKEYRGILPYLYIYKILVMLGYGLGTENCTKCQNFFNKGGKKFLDLFSGGFRCDACSDKSAVEISDNCLKMLGFISKNNFERYTRVTLDKSLEVETIKIIKLYLNNVYQKEMNSAKFIRSVNQLQKRPKQAKI